MFRNTLSKTLSKVALIFVLLILLITLRPVFLHAEVEQSVKIVSNTVIPDFRFIFQAGTDTTINLYLAGSDGQIQELTHSSFAQNPSLSPDGKSVFFEDAVDSKIGQLYQIFKLDLDSKKITLISNGSSLDCNPICAPDGKHLAFCTRAVDPNISIPWRIYLMDINGKNRHSLDTQIDTQDTKIDTKIDTQAKIISQLTPCWSPDSAKIVFVHNQLLRIEGLPLAFPIATPKVRDLKTKTVNNLLPGGFAVNETAWSPLGDRIAFRGHDPITDTKTIWTFTADGTRLERVTDGPDDAQPAWWPDGTKLVFARRKEGKKRIICMIDLKTRKVTELFSSNDASLERPQVLPVKPHQRYSSGKLSVKDH